MGGHSHWAGIKHKKGLKDQKRGKVFTRLIREITIAARLGGGDPEGNARLRKAIDDAKAANMPADNVKRGILRGTGQLPGAAYEEVTYEGYGPGGAAILCEATTDNRNRTTSEIRRLFTDRGGNLGESGSVAWMFELKGYITIKKSDTTEDQLMALALDLGAEDIRSDESDVYEVITSAQDLPKVKGGLESKGLALSSAEVTRLPKSEVPVQEKDAPKILALMDALEDHDDIKNVYSNFDIPDTVLAHLTK